MESPSSLVVVTDLEVPPVEFDVVCVMALVMVWVVDPSALRTVTSVAFMVSMGSKSLTAPLICTVLLSPVALVVVVVS